MCTQFHAGCKPFTFGFNDIDLTVCAFCTNIHKPRISLKMAELS